MPIVATLFIIAIGFLILRIAYLRMLASQPKPQLIVITNVRSLRQRIRNYDTKVLPFKKRDL